MKEEKIIKWDDWKWLGTHLKNNIDIKEVSNYLKDNNLEIKVVIYNKDKSPETGYQYRVYLEGVDLSGNGCCFSGDRLMYHIKVHRKFISISEEDGYRKYLNERGKYESTYKYLNK